MVICETCLEWFHEGCVNIDLKKKGDFKCDWCEGKLDDKGKQVCKFRGQQKRRAPSNMPINRAKKNGGQTHPILYENPPAWDDKVEETKARSKKIIRKKKKLRKS